MISHRLVRIANALETNWLAGCAPTAEEFDAVIAALRGLAKEVHHLEQAAVPGHARLDGKELRELGVALLTDARRGQPRAGVRRPRGGGDAA